MAGKKITQDSINDYRLPMETFTERFQQDCKNCDHYYAMAKATNGRLYKGHFCCHWGETSIGRFEYREAILSCQDRIEGCAYYRNRHSQHPFNSLRKNKLYLDMNPVEFL